MVKFGEYQPYILLTGHTQAHTLREEIKFLLNEVQAAYKKWFFVLTMYLQPIHVVSSW
jgi:hypothetical protein